MEQTELSIHSALIHRYVRHPGRGSVLLSIHSALIPRKIPAVKMAILEHFQFILHWYARSSHRGRWERTPLSIHSALIRALTSRSGGFSVTFNSFCIDTNTSFQTGRQHTRTFNSFCIDTARCRYCPAPEVRPFNSFCIDTNMVKRAHLAAVYQSGRIFHFQFILHWYLQRVAEVLEDVRQYFQFILHWYQHA